LVQYDDPHVKELRAFRDILRVDDSLRTHYEALKCNLANEFRDDREAYTNAKAGFVKDVLRQRGIEPIRPR
jgi:GrpB-like predicted nucleotidyltransferase (UPF0157 family)